MSRLQYFHLYTFDFSEADLMLGCWESTINTPSNTPSFRVHNHVYPFLMGSR